MDKKTLPESAALDHTKVIAPYVRTAGVIPITGEKNIIYKYDIRLIQPNTGLVPTKVMHTLEHLFAVTMRNHLDGMIDIGPMGCLTGFYFIALNQTYEKIVGALEQALHDILTFEDIPFANELQCGSAKHHDLLGAKKYAEIMLDGRSNWEIGGKAGMNFSSNIELH